ncbi:MAG: rRNA maturation RNase YbeY [Planctomycetales bacterium]|nr:rRNA maturation RNase YbeY [Planctomycetales bacterium]
MDAYLIEVNNQQVSLSIDEDAITRAVRTILINEQIQRAQISVALVDDPTMHDLNRRYLDHDYPTDVLSFVLEQQGQAYLEGEIIVSTDTAIRCCTEYHWSATQELFLYVIHGMLHLVGFDDTEDSLRTEMRLRERHYLQALNIEFPPESTIDSSQGSESSGEPQP